MNGNASIRIGLFSPPIGNGNLGDEATVAAVIQNVRSRLATPDIYAICSDPNESMQRHGISAVPYRPRIGKSRRIEHVPQSPSSPEASTEQGNVFETLKLYVKSIAPIYRALKALQAILQACATCVYELLFGVRAFNLLRRTDMVIIAGSGFLSDHFDGVFNFPLRIFEWSALAKLAGAKLVFLSVGAGPLTSRLSRWFIRKALLWGDYRSFRDQTSARLAERLGLPRPHLVFPDLAHTLQVDPTPSVPTASSTLVAINVFPHCDPRYWPSGNPQAYQRYVREMALFASWLLDGGFRVTIFPTQFRADPPVIHDVVNAVWEIRRPRMAHDDMSEVSVTQVVDLCEHLSHADVVVATRFHGILLSFLLGKPVLALSNHHKMADLMADMGQGEFLLDIDRFTWQSLGDRFLLLLSAKDRVRTQIAERVTVYRELLRSQYDRIIGPADSILVPPILNRLRPADSTNALESS